MSEINKVQAGEIGIFRSMIGSGCIVVQKHDGVVKTLLVKHGEKPLEELKWKFPGGKLLKGMGIKDNALRETKEEIGVEAKIISPTASVVSLWNQVPESGNEVPEFMILTNYLAIIDAEPVAHPDIKAMEWFDVNNLPSDCSPNIKPGIDDYREQISQL